MSPKINKTQGTSTPKTAFLGQFIACAIALCIMALGVWSLLGQKAPYHPDSFGPEVTRGTSNLTGMSESN